MNPILLSALCGAAFIGAGAAVVVMVAVIVQNRQTKASQEAMEALRKGNEMRFRTCQAVERIADALECRDHPAQDIAMAALNNEVHRLRGEIYARNKSDAEAAAI